MAGGFADAGSDDLTSAVDNTRPESLSQCKKPKWCEPLGLALLAERAAASAELSEYFRTFHSISLIKFLL